MQIDLTVIEACFTGGIFEGGSETIRYRVYRSGTDVSKQLSIKPEGFNEILRASAQQLGAADSYTYLYLLGHSHGGWLMMNAAQSWDSPMQIRGLFTIDPISYRRCGQGYMISEAILTGTVPRFLTIPNAECTRPPADLTPSVISNKVQKRWVNFYQNQFVFLHSGPIPLAQSVYVQFPESGIAGFQHRDILFDDRVWTRIKSEIRKDLLDLAASL